MYHVLICDDQPDIVNALKIYLKPEGYDLLTAANGSEAVELAKVKNLDLILMDIMMPQMDGIMATSRIRELSNVPIIFLTALSDEEDKLLGYELGADDYVTKPFVMSVLYAKTMALIKRNQRNVLAGDRMQAGGITLELSTRRVFAGTQEVVLTPKEYALLRCLMQNKNLVLSREQLLVKCWGYDYEGEARAVDTHIKRLREKLGGHAACIKTVIKAGYRLEG